MKLLTGILLLILAVPALAQNLKTAVPKYDSSREQVFKGVVEDLRDRSCPVSGGIGAHIVLRVEDNSVIEVHLATSEFTKMVEMNLRKNDRIEVTGFKTEFEGVPTIFARSVRRGVDEFVFRDKDGKPIW
jgi:hypothetical protein